MPQKVNNSRFQEHEVTDGLTSKSTVGLHYTKKVRSDNNEQRECTLSLMLSQGQPSPSNERWTASTRYKAWCWTEHKRSQLHPSIRQTPGDYKADKSTQQREWSNP